MPYYFCYEFLELFVCYHLPKIKKCPINMIYVVNSIDEPLLKSRGRRLPIALALVNMRSRGESNAWHPDAPCHVTRCHPSGGGCMTSLGSYKTMQHAAELTINEAPSCGQKRKYHQVGLSSLRHLCQLLILSYFNFNRAK